MRTAAHATLDRSVSGLAGGLVFALALLAIVLLFTVSPMVLYQLGWAYEAPGGSAFEKLHPATFVTVLAFLLVMLRRVDPIRYIDQLVTRQKGTLAFLAIWFVLLAHVLFVQRTPFTPIIDSFLLPMLLFLVMREFDATALRRLALLLHALLALNALIGLGEFFVGFRLTPYVAGSVLIVGDWRSTALLGHPLMNAAMTSAYVLILAFGGGRDLPFILRLGAIITQLAAVPVFGGRAAMVLMLLVLIGLGLVHLIRLLSGARVRPLEAAAGVMAVPAAAMALGAIAASGFFDRFLERFVRDDRSAETRLDMLNIFGEIPFPELLLNPDPELVGTLQRLEGLEFGLESFPLAFMLYYGVVISCLVFFGLFLFCLDIRRACRPGPTTWLLIYFFGVCSTSLTLASKTPIMALLIALLLTMLRPEAAPPPRRRAV